MASEKLDLLGIKKEGCIPVGWSLVGTINSRISIYLVPGHGYILVEVHRTPGGAEITRIEVVGKTKEEVRLRVLPQQVVWIQHTK